MGIHTTSATVIFRKWTDICWNIDICKHVQMLDSISQNHKVQSMALEWRRRIVFQIPQSSPSAGKARERYAPVFSLMCAKALREHRFHIFPLFCSYFRQTERSATSLNLRVAHLCFNSVLSQSLQYLVCVWQRSLPCLWSKAKEECARHA